MGFIKVMDKLYHSTSMFRLGVVLMIIVLYPIFTSGNLGRIIELLAGIALGSVISLVHYLMFGRLHDE